MTDIVSVERTIAARPEMAWGLISDVTHMKDFSPETVGCDWIGSRREPVVGARFRGTNQSGKRRWKTACTVVAADPGRVFAFEVKAMGLSVARWEYRFEAAGEGSCRATETWTDQRGKLVNWIGPKLTGVSDRAAHNKIGMAATLEKLAAKAESSAA